MQPCQPVSCESVTIETGIQIFLAIGWPHGVGIFIDTKPVTLWLKPLSTCTTVNLSLGRTDLDTFTEASFVYLS
jgi:hypothetical protein